MNIKYIMEWSEKSDLIRYSSHIPERYIYVVYINRQLYIWVILHWQNLFTHFDNRRNLMTLSKQMCLEHTRPACVWIDLPIKNIVTAQF